MLREKYVKVFVSNESSLLNDLRIDVWGPQSLDLRDEEISDPLNGLWGGISLVPLTKVTNRIPAS